MVLDFVAVAVVDAVRVATGKCLAEKDEVAHDLEDKSVVEKGAVQLCHELPSGTDVLARVEGMARGKVCAEDAACRDTASCVRQREQSEDMGYTGGERGPCMGVPRQCLHGLEGLVGQMP